MSEEKLYAVKNDEGKYWDFKDRDDFWKLSYASCPTTDNELDAKDVIHDHGGHVVTFVEEPEKVVLSKEQAEIVENARISRYPATNISKPAYCSDDEQLLIQALVKGYTVGQVKKYLVYKELGGKQKYEHFAQAYRSPLFPDTITWFVEDRKSHKTGVSAQFTEAEIEHYGLQDCEKEEVTDDEQ